MGIPSALFGPQIPWSVIPFGVTVRVSSCTDLLGGNLLDGATSYKELGFFSRFQGVFFLEILSVSVNSLPQRGTENY